MDHQQQFPKKILVVCKGNSDRSPLMAAVLQRFLRDSGKVVTCESAGTFEKVAGAGGGASPYGVAAGKVIGLDISDHCKLWINKFALDDWDLFICMDEEIAMYVLDLVGEINKHKIYNAKVPNCWPVQFQEDFDTVTVPQILGASYRVMTRYFN